MALACLQACRGGAGAAGCPAMRPSRHPPPHAFHPSACLSHVSHPVPVAGVLHDRQPHPQGTVVWGSGAAPVPPRRRPCPASRAPALTQRPPMSARTSGPHTPQEGRWEDVSGETFLRRLLSMPLEETRWCAPAPRAGQRHGWAGRGADGRRPAARLAPPHLACPLLPCPSAGTFTGVTPCTRGRARWGWTLAPSRRCGRVGVVWVDGQTGIRPPARQHAARPNVGGP